MAKYPTPGRVKTRLHPTLTPEQAAEVQKVFLLHTIARLQAMSAAPVVVCFDPPEQAAAFVGLLGPEMELIPQSPGDLGHRMASAAVTLGKRFDRLLFFGVDSPDVPEKALRELHELALAHEAMLAPTHDGGYWSVGGSTDLKWVNILRDIAWSSGRECAQTKSALEAAGHTVALAQAWSDVDHPADLYALVDRLTLGSTDDDLQLLKLIHPFAAHREREKVVA